MTDDRDVRILKDSIEVVGIDERHGFAYEIALEDGRRLRGVARLDDMKIIDDASLADYVDDPRTEP